MEYCSKCYRKICRCGMPKVEIDYYIYPAIYELNRKGYRTSSCCSGHDSDEHLSTYISFSEEIDADIISDYFDYDSYSYRGFHERRNCVRVKSEVVKKFKKKRTNKLELVQAINRDLYAWAKSLPTRVPLEDRGMGFPADYFDKEVILDEVVDVQKPWILFTKVGQGCRYTADDFFNEIECKGEMTEIVVNRTGRVKTFCDSDYGIRGKHLGNSSFLKDKIKFDISGDYRLLLCGYEPYVMIERLLVGDATWYLSYARTDIAIAYGDGGDYAYVEGFAEDEDPEDYMDKNTAKTSVNSRRCAYTENLFDEDDIGDYVAEHPGANDFDLFARMFDRMSRMSINICVFSGDNIDIVFSNKTDFSVLMTNDQNVIAFGEADYDYMDFPRVSVDRKEALVYANGRLLMRKDVE